MDAEEIYSPIDIVFISLSDWLVALTERGNSCDFRSSFRIVIASTWKKLLTRIIVFVFVCCPGIDTKHAIDANRLLHPFHRLTRRVQSLFVALHTLTCICR